MQRQQHAAFWFRSGCGASQILIQVDKSGIGVMLIFFTLALIGCPQQPPFSDTTLIASFEKLAARKFPDAKTLLVAGRKARPVEPLIMNNLAVTLALEGKYKDAIKLLNEALPLAEDYKLADEAYSCVIQGKTSVQALDAVQPYGVASALKSTWNDNLPLFIAPGECTVLKLRLPRPVDPQTQKKRETFLLKPVIKSNIDAISQLVN